MRRRLRKKANKIKEMVPDNVADAATSLNPLSPVKTEEPPSLENVPRITNETIAEHREEVLKGARKYIYPLQHSKHRIIVLTSTILITAIIAFIVYSALALYRLNQYNTFLYRATQVVPFPIARIEDNFVAYENYLFELRHYVHYYQNQLGRNFAGADKQQLVQFRHQALNNVINDAYIKTLAKQNNVGVSGKEVNSRIEQVRNQNRLGSNNKVFADVLRDYWGWSISDFKRSLRQQILAEKVVAKLDKAANQKANALLVQAKSGADFNKLAAQSSDDPSAKINNGDYGFPITKTNPNIAPQVVEVLFKLKPGQISGIINTGSALEIVKLDQVNGNSVTAHHITVGLKDISGYIKDIKDKKPSKTYIKL